MLKVAVVILVIMLAYGGVYALMSIIVPKATMGSTFKARTGKALDSVQDADYLGVLVGIHRQLGLYALTTTISGFFVLFAAFRKAQKWAWWCFLVVGGIAWLWGMISAIVIGDKVNMPLQIIGMVIFLVGILIPIKVFFAKEASATKAPGATEEA